MKNSDFSIITACYNTGKYVRACVESILGQHYPRKSFELVCIDDGSTDDSTSILRSFDGVEGFVLRRTTNQGLEAACNLGISIARFDRIVRVDADDLLDLNYLHAMNDAIQKWPENDFYYCKEFVEYYSDKDQRRKVLPEFDVEEIFSRGDFFATGTVYRKDDLRTVGFYDFREKNCGLENYNLVLRLIDHGKRGIAVPGALFYYRRHHENMSTVKVRQIIDYGKRLLHSHGRKFMTNEYHPYNLKIEQL